MRNSFIADNGRRLPTFDLLDNTLNRVGAHIDSAPDVHTRGRWMRSYEILVSLWREVCDNAHIV